MFTSNLDEREVQLLIVALRYWRSHRTGGLVRRTDPKLVPETVDILLTKLMAMTSLPTERTTECAAAYDPFADLDAAAADR